MTRGDGAEAADGAGAVSAEDAAAVERARALLTAMAARLAAAGARDEALARYEEPKPALGVIPRRPTMRPLGRAWRLGALLLQADGSVWATGISTRVAEPGRPQHHSASVETRRAYRAAAIQGGFPMGETVNHSVAPIALDATLIGGPGPLVVRDGEVWVRWGSDAPVPLARYLDDLADLLLHPPQGA
ncbi:hypothetical protein [Agrococcus carbonis]|uniref:Glutaminase n=1 Tax=Agrococcus carbonis TaxID=684552 RepID=A0A1H1KUI4_9MICO|nr:hypothetical protein [Agrococcus carbonis]SDR65680.1 hypothetical protein SAMN04489719_0103 [Agrococcus carbonis]